MKLPPTTSVSTFNCSEHSCLIHWIFLYLVAIVTDQKLFHLSHRCSKSQRYHCFSALNKKHRDDFFIDDRQLFPLAYRRFKSQRWCSLSLARPSSGAETHMHYKILSKRYHSFEGEMN